MNDIIIRTASIDDATDIFLINNSTFVRKQAINQNIFTFDEHLAWFKNMLNDINVVFYTAVNPQGDFIGLIHFDKHKNEDCFVVSVAIAEKYAGKGFGSFLIKNSTDNFKSTNGKEVVAFVKESNVASSKAFVNAGYKFVDKVDIFQEKYLKYRI